MKNKILATTIGMILAGGMGMAQADVTITGNVNVSIDSIDEDGGSDDINMNSNTSSVMVKGSEDLGNGLSAIFAVDFQFDADERNAPVDRDQWVGLKGGFGSVKFGTISTSYKSHGAMIDPIYRTSLQGRNHGLQSNMHNGAGENGAGRMTNHIRYDSPNFSGFKATVDYSLDSTDAVGNSDADTYAIGGQYMNGPVLVFADYLTNDQGGADDAWKVGGKFSMDMFAFYAQYENDGGVISSINNEAATGAAENTLEDADVWHVGASATLGSTLLYFGFAQGDNDNSVANGKEEYSSWTLAADHRMSKRTDAYAGFNQVDCEGTTTNTNMVCNGLPAAGGEIDFFSVGLRHKF